MFGLGVEEPDQCCNPKVDISKWKSEKSSSGYFGVSLDRGRYNAKLVVHGKSIHLGRYDTAEEAAVVSATKRMELLGPEDLNEDEMEAGLQEHVKTGKKESNAKEDSPEGKQTQAKKAVETEVKDEWLDSGHQWMSKRVVRVFGTQKVGAVVTGWMPASAEDPALFHIQHDDGT